jgi:hypothetical protein
VKKQFTTGGLKVGSADADASKRDNPLPEEFLRIPAGNPANM